MAILKFKDENGNFVDIPVIEGKPGKQGEPGPQGPAGENGVDGKDGYTPIRGTDYWTPTDISTIERYCNNYIDSQLGTINEQLASLTEVE